MLYIFYGVTVAFQHIGKPLRADGDRPSHKFGDVVAFHELPVEVGICTWQFERLRPSAVVVDMCEEGACIFPVVSAATEYQPPAIARPGVIALRVRTIDFV